MNQHVGDAHDQQQRCADQVSWFERHFYPSVPEMTINLAEVLAQEGMVPGHQRIQAGSCHTAQVEGSWSCIFVS